MTNNGRRKQSRKPRALKKKKDHRAPPGLDLRFITLVLALAFE
jgi:hypothetical protein